VFGSHAPSDPAWTWTDDQTVGFWIRRMAQETAVHRVDAELAIGDRTPIDPALALDGIDEMIASTFQAFQRHWPEELARVLGADSESAQVVAVRAGGREWMVGFAGGTLDFAPSGPADATVEGPAEQVLLWMWNRVGDAEVTITGNASTIGLARRVLEAAGQ
jgi:uncharacterized protein (TIGR03083 family)